MAQERGARAGADRPGTSGLEVLGEASLGLGPGRGPRAGAKSGLCLAPVLPGARALRKISTKDLQGGGPGLASVLAQREGPELGLIDLGPPGWRSWVR